MSDVKVRTVCEGKIVRDGKAILEAHSSCTLIEGDELVVVDTSDAAYRSKVIDGLKALGVDPAQVSFVINTHLHPDHRSNNDLFIKAKRIAHRLERPGPSFQVMEGETLELISDVKIIHTPGHSPGSVSVFIGADRRTVIAGDAIPTIDNYLKMVPPGVTTDPEQAMESMRRILAWAEVVVPGHGPPFQVKD